MQLRPHIEPPASELPASKAREVRKLHRAGCVSIALAFQLQRLGNIAQVNEHEYRYLFAQMGLHARAVSNEPIIAGKDARGRDLQFLQVPFTCTPLLRSEAMRILRRQAPGLYVLPAALRLALLLQN